MSVSKHVVLTVFTLLASLTSVADQVVIKHHSSTIRSVELDLPKRTDSNQFNVKDFGATGDGRTLDRKPIQNAIDHAEANGGGFVIVPEGRYLIGGLILKSNVYLDLQEFSELVASEKPEDFMVWKGQPKQSEDDEYHWNVVSGHGIENSGIIGKGTINGMGNEKYVRFYSARDDRFEPVRWTVDDCVGECRPELVRFNRSKNLIFYDFTLTNSPRWTFHLKGSDNILIDGIRVLGDPRMPNNDGIDIDSSRNVTIRNAYVSTADDGICLKSSIGYGPIDNLLVENTIIRSKSSAIKVGSGVDEDMSNAYFRNIRIFDSNRGLGIQQVGYNGKGDVYDFTFENIDIETGYKADRWWGNGEPIWIVSIPRNDSAELGKTYNIHFKDITAVSEHGILLAGREEAPLENITFDNVHVHYDLWSGLRLPYREYTAANHENGEKVLDAVDGLFIEYADGVSFKDSSFTFHQLTADYYRDCYRSTAVTDANLESLTCTRLPVSENWKARARDLTGVNF